MIYGNVGNDVSKLDISAFPVNEKAKVDIVGNDNFVVGENNIKIVVTSENAKMQKTYTLKVNKEEVNSLLDVENKTNNTNQIIESSNFKDTLSVIGEILKEKSSVLLLYAFVWIEFLQVVYLYEKVKVLENRNKIKDDKKD